LLYSPVGEWARSNWRYAVGARSNGRYAVVGTLPEFVIYVMAKLLIKLNTV
jgi:hypothetical protein